MRKFILPPRYFLILLLVVLVMIGLEFVDSTNARIFPFSLLSDPVLANILNTLFIAILILILYTIGVYLLVRRIKDEASRFTAVRITMTILLAIGAFLVLMIWIEEPSQIVLILGIVWGATVIALRDLIQNMVGSLSLLITGMYRIGDRIKLRGIYGLVMDIGFFRTTLMELDRESGDLPTGEIITVPNGILFREVVTNTTRHLSVVSDEIRITVPFSADLEKIRAALTDTAARHTKEIGERASREIGQLSEKKYFPGFETKPTINLVLDSYGIVVILKYITDSRERSAIKNRIIEEISRQNPSLLTNEKWG